jgi:hypothetical protein
MKSIRLAGALTVAAALAVPAVASAHPSVYKDTARVLTDPNDPATITDQTRYVVTNHGFTMVLRETNGLAAPKGVLTYSKLPSAYRKTIEFSQWQTEGGTGAQVHATCQVPALETEDAIKGWQGADPFYNYVPFQKDAAGFEDDPATWIDDVRQLTSDAVDLRTLNDAAAAEAACEALPGATATSYTPADEIQTTASALASGTVEHATAPLTAQIATLTKAVTDADAAKAALQTALDAAKAELVKLATPIKAALPSAKLKAGSLAKTGTSVTVTGPAGAPVRVELAISEGQARKLKLKSSVLGSAKATLGADGAAKISLKAKKSARKALRKLKRSVAIEVTVISGDRFTTSGGTLTR